MGGVAALALALAVAGCGGNGAGATTTSASNVPGAGQGVGYALVANGMVKCAGPLDTTADPDGATGAPTYASLAVYAEPGFGALVASGAGAQRHAINLVVTRNNVPTNVTPAEISSVERAWRAQARRALHRPGVPAGPCRSELPQLPVLSATEVVCPDEVLIPFGHRGAMDTFVHVLSRLLNVTITPQQEIYLGQFNYLTVPGSTSVTRPYCAAS